MPTSNQPKKTPPPPPASGFGLLVLLMAALPFSDSTGKTGITNFENPETVYTRPSLASYSNLCYSASMMDDASEHEAALLSGYDEESVSEEEMRRRRRRKSAKRQTSSDSEEDSSSQYTDEVVSVDCENTSVSSILTSSPRVYQIGDDALCQVMSYLPLKDVTACRTVSRALNKAAAADVPTPLPGSIFIRFNGDSNRDGSFAEAPSRNQLRWICNYCETANGVTVGVCRRCGGGNTDCQGIRRVFLGQLRKERTTELADWLISRVFPDMEVFHIENHTSSKDGRGKGCAWIYVSNAYDEARLISLNKRLFVDVDADRREGVWFCSPDHLQELANMAASRAYHKSRPQVLPRQPLVCERPALRTVPKSAQASSTPRPAWSQTSATAEELWSGAGAAPWYPSNYTAGTWGYNMAATPFYPSAAAPAPSSSPSSQGKIYSHNPYAFKALEHPTEEVAY